MDDLFDFSQGSADSNYSQPSSDLSLDEEKESLRREKERQALNQLEKARVSHWSFVRSSLLRAIPILSRMLDHRLSIERVSHHRRDISLRYKDYEEIMRMNLFVLQSNLQFQDRKQKKKTQNSARCQDTLLNFFLRSIAQTRR